MSKPLLSLCSIPKIATRDGWVGATARILLPFYGYWFASGQTLSAPAANVGQDLSRTLTGTDKPDTYSKSAGVCLRP